MKRRNYGDYFYALLTGLTIPLVAFIMFATNREALGELTFPVCDQLWLVSRLQNDFARCLIAAFALSVLVVNLRYARNSGLEIRNKKEEIVRMGLNIVWWLLVFLLLDSTSGICDDFSEGLSRMRKVKIIQ